MTTLRLVYLMYIPPILIDLHLVVSPQTPSSQHSLSLPTLQPISFLLTMTATHLHSVQNVYPTAGTH